MRSLAFFLILPCCSSVCHAAESDALSILATIQARHLPYGTILDPIFAGPDSNQIIDYTRCGDSAIWTGHYLAAEAFRYKVTGAADALANSQSAIAGLTLLTDVTGTNVLARCAVPVNSEYILSIVQQEVANGSFVGSAADGSAYTWIGNTSRDEYLGAFFGLCVAYDMIGDAPTRAQIAALITRLLDNLVDHVWTVVMPDLSVSTTFVARPDQQLTLLQIGRHVNSKYNDAYSALAVLAPSVIAPISIDCSDTHGSYFKFNLDYISFYHLIGLETSSIRKFFYTEAYDILRNATGTHLNAHFDAIDRSIRGPNTGRDYDTRNFLDQWLTRPRRDPEVDLVGVYPSCGSSGTEACNPIPVPARVPTDFLWQRDPFQLAGGGSGTIEGAGIDYILPYWMARYYGVETQ
ncbi:MAG TPA: hypothetical protein VK752_09720 [Bryobacteraceae bacterium]|nr:hypothetical protein [Bryobacteraceae bacterium]